MGRQIIGWSHFFCFFRRYFSSLYSGRIIVITAPSGSGKTTLVKRLMAVCPHLAFSVSACTRPPRDGEVDGRDYYFYDERQFRELIEEEAFLEWEMVYPGKYYGTLKTELFRIWGQGKCPLVDIDVQGAMVIKSRFPDRCMTLFIEAPSLEVLRARLKGRGTETEQGIEERVAKAAHELTFAGEFDHIIINDDLEQAVHRLVRLVEEFIGCR